jgi:hypothetical protein
MKVEALTHVEDCFDGSHIKELVFAECIQKNHIQRLGKRGYLQYFEHFARPFFKIRIEGKCDLKGVEGNRTMRVHIKNHSEYSIEQFIFSIRHI